MKKILSLLILSLLMLTGCTTKKEVKNPLDIIRERDVLIVGVKDDSKPHGFVSKSTGEIVGFDIDIARNIAKELLGSERKVKLVPVTTDNRIEAVTSGQVDMVIATMSITPQREYLIDFSVPYYIAGQTILVPEDSDIYTFSDLKRKTIIISLGSTAEKNIRKIIPTAKIIGYKTYDEAFQAFIDGKGDAISSDDTILSGLMIDHEGYRLLKNRISREPYAVAIKKHEDKRLKKNLDVIITRMQKDGTLKELEDKWHLK